MLDTGSIRSAELNQFLEIFMAQSTRDRNAVQARRDELDVRTSIYNDLKTKLKTLRDLAKEFGETGSLSPFAAKTVSVSDESVLKVTAGSAAASLSHSIHVDQLAHAHSVLSNQYTRTGTDISAANTGTKTFSITVDGTQYDVSVNINSGDTNDTVLTAVADAINAVTDIEAIASPVKDTDTTAKLSITSEKTGSTYKMTFTDTDGLLASLGVTNSAAATTSTGGYVYADLGGNELDSMLTVDGISIVRSSNTLSDVISGVTIELLASQDTADADVSATVSVDTEAITTKMNEFLDAFNSAYSYLAAKVDVDPVSYVRGDLAGDYPYLNLWKNMRTDIAGSVSGTTNGVFTALSQIGITSGETGNYSITDTSAFDDALNDNLSDVQDLFTASDGIAGRLEALLDNYVDVSGIIDTSKDAVNDKAELLDNRLDRLDRMQKLEEDRLIEQFGALQQATYMNQAMLATLSSLSSYYQ